MRHELETVQDGCLWHHTCIHCGEKKTTKTPNWVGICGSLTSDLIAKAEAEYPCIHRGELTGNSVTGCGCAVPNWRKQLYQCEIHGSCVLLKLPKLPGQTNCQSCGDREQSES